MIGVGMRLKLDTMNGNPLVRTVAGVRGQRCTSQNIPTDWYRLGTRVGWVQSWL